MVASTLRAYGNSHRATTKLEALQGAIKKNGKPRLEMPGDPVTPTTHGPPAAQKACGGKDMVASTLWAHGNTHRAITPEALEGAIRKDGKPRLIMPGYPVTPSTHGPPCEWRGSKHQQERRYCAARNKACRYCGITSHLEALAVVDCAAAAAAASAASSVGGVGRTQNHNDGGAPATARGTADEPTYLAHSRSLQKMYKTKQQDDGGGGATKHQVKPGEVSSIWGQDSSLHKTGRNGPGSRPAETDRKHDIIDGGNITYDNVCLLSDKSSNK